MRDRAMRIALPVQASIVLALVFGVLVSPLSAAAQGVASAGRPRIALLPMVVHSSESPDYLRSGLSDMLTARFTQEGVLEVVRIDDPALATTDVRAAIAAARKASAQFVLFGSFTRFGQGASLDVQTAAVAEGPNGQTLREIFVHSGSIGKVIPDLDDLVGKVTRFAVADYTRDGGTIAPPAGAASGAAPSPSTSVGLEARVAALEAQIEALQNASPPE